jgi:hypothetical protein
MKHFTLVYRSRPVFSGSVADYLAEIEKIVETSRRRNERTSVSGALLFNEDWFVHLLEGTEADVRATFARISADPRHEEVAILFERYTRERRLQNWSLAFVGQAPAIRKHFSSTMTADPGITLRGYEVVEFVVAMVTGDGARQGTP